LRRLRPYGEEMRRFQEQWDMTDHQGKVNLCANYNITYETGKRWRNMPAESEPWRPSPDAPNQQIMKRIKPNVPLRLKIEDKPQTIAVFNDTHNPFQDVKTLALAEDFIKDLQPDYLIYNGDINDFYQISKFDKNPARYSELQKDIDNTRDMLKRHRQLCPNAIIKLLDGNHENRLERFLWTNAPALSSLRCLEVEKLLELQNFEIERIPYECGIMVNDIFLIIHGNLVSTHSSYTAKRMFEKHGGCGLCAHSHRLGEYLKRNRFGTWGWWEGGCLCDLNPDYVTNPDWHQGFTLVHFKGKRFWMEQIPILGHTLMYGSKIYEPQKNGGA
jgi:hypothetical protein